MKELRMYCIGCLPGILGIHSVVSLGYRPEEATFVTVGVAFLCATAFTTTTISHSYLISAFIATTAACAASCVTATTTNSLYIAGGFSVTFAGLAIAFAVTFANTFAREEDVPVKNVLLLLAIELSGVFFALWALWAGPLWAVLIAVLVSGALMFWLGSKRWEKPSALGT